ncbi:MATE family efflux transporter [Anaerorhabdus sp.]|uniref:MATE family efflux transporter n=1 Tax=Anaerorhabdus sp. TaxID=1872524 RepID=UPI002FCA7EE6
MENSDFLGKEPIGKLLFRLALPAITAQLINMLYNVVDRIYIGHIPNIGSLALTGVGVCMPIIMLITAFASLVSMGGAPRASIFMGKNDNKTATKIMSNCFTMLLLVSVVITGVLFFFQEDLLLMFGASQNTIKYAMDYMFIYSLGTVFVQLALGMNAFITAQGFAKTSMLTVLIGAITNIVLDPILIFGFNMGVQGAAIATVLSQAISAIWVVWFLLGKKTILKINLKDMKLDAKLILPCIALGVSPFIMQSTESIIAVCFNSSLLKYGGDIAVGAMTILTSVMQFSMLPLQGITQGAQPITSYNYGAKNARRVKETFTKLLQSSFIYSAILWAAIMIAPKMFATLFTTDLALIEYAESALKIYMAVSVLFSVQLSCQMTLIAIGNVKSSVFLAILRKILLLIPLIYILPRIFTNNQTTAVYLAEPVADTIAVLCTIIIFTRQFKKALKEIGEGDTVLELEKSF